jgi:uncharacterized protein YrrD
VLTRTKDLHGWTVAACDGALGHVADVYLDDRRWVVCYLVVDTGRWLSGGKVLVAPHSVSEVDPVRRRLQTPLRRQQLVLGPDPDLVRPVSRQHETDLCHCYGFPSYAVIVGASMALAGPAPDARLRRGVDPHLRSVRAITGYYVHARDGDVGHVEDILVDDRAWGVRYLLVSVGRWLPHRSVLVPIGWVARVSWDASAVTVSLPAEAIRLAPNYDRAAGLSPTQEARLACYYGLPPFAPT